VIITTRTKESIKTALAMTIAYGIALSMNWENAYWAGFAVAFISSSNIGQSFNKGAMRMLGTLIAVVVALTIISLFVQDRWLFMICLSAYVGFCTYMMGGERLQYFWFVCGFVCVIICMDAGFNSVNAFYTAILRTQETGLGILVYSLVAILLWPQHSGKALNIIVSKLANTQQQLLKTSLTLVNAQTDDTVNVKNLILKESQESANFSQLLNNAESDTEEVRELRPQWRNYQKDTLALTQAIARWRESITDLQSLNITQLLPNFIEFTSELNDRLMLIKQIATNREPERQTKNIMLNVDENEVRRLSHFQQAALAIARTQLQQLDTATRSLFKSMSAIKRIDFSEKSIDSVNSSPKVFVLDPDRLLSVSRIVMIMWLAYLSLIYVDSIPGGAGFVSMTSVIGMILVTTPQLSVTKLIFPLSGSILFASVIYIFVMPQMSSFLSLAALLFTVTATICYLFSTPQQGLSRALGLAIFVSIASISNQQTYSFLVVATTAVMFPLALLILLISAYVPVSLNPEQVFLRLLRRYFRNCEYLFSHIQNNSQPLNLIERYKHTLHLRDLAKVSQNLSSWFPLIKVKNLSGTSAEQIPLLVTSLQNLADKTQLLFDSNTYSQSTSLMQPLQKGLFDWQYKLEQISKTLSIDPSSANNDILSLELKRIIATMEKSLEESLNQETENQVSKQHRENLYSLLGTYRTVSAAIIDYASYTKDIDWAYWKEHKFV
jgi:uncharacterized membrane protein YccC